MYYKYIGLNLNNQKIIKGDIEGNSEDEVTKILLDKNIVLQSIKKIEHKNKIKFNLFKKNNLLLEIFTEKLYSFLSADTELKVSLQLLLIDEKNKYLRLFILSILDNLKNGDSFYLSLKKQNIIKIPKYYIESIKVGDDNNNLSSIFEQLVNYNDSKNQNKDNIIQALTYPLIILGVSSIVLVFMMTSIVPKIVSMFDNNHQELPKITQTIINISDFIINNYQSIIGITFFFIIFFTFLIKKNKKIQYLVDYLSLKTPFYGELIQNKELSRFLYLLHVLLENNINSGKALDISKDIISNKVLYNEITNNINDLSEGKSLAEAFKISKNLNKDFLMFIFISDTNNNLKDISKKTSIRINNKNSKKIKKFISLLEPLSMILIGSILGVIIISILLPIFSLGN